jgi:hypothetical protein
MGFDGAFMRREEELEMMVKQGIVALESEHAGSAS